MANQPDAAHFEMVANRLLDGGVVPFLGAGVNLCGRPETAHWERGRYLPSGSELASHLATGIGLRYPYGDSSDLLRVSQYVDVSLGNGPLYEALHAVFDADYSPTPVHRTLAAVPALIRARAAGAHCFYPLYITTNYDDALENAFRDAGEEFDLLTYIADGPSSGKFRHTRPDGTSEVILVPNSYTGLTCDERPVIAKIHGAVDRHAEQDDSFVITENHYIEYLSRSDTAQLIPVNILARMHRCNFLFLGYSLSDWNLRVILHRLWGDRGLKYNSWAVQPQPERIEEKAWARRNVELLDMRLEEYTTELDSWLTRALQPATESP